MPNNEGLVRIRRAFVTLTVGAGVACSALAQPIITQQPTNTIIASGQSANLSIIASGSGALGYQWFKDGVRLVEQTNSTLSVASFQFTNSGNYQVVVTNGAGMVISQPRFLSVAGMSLLLAWGYNNYGQLGNGLGVDHFYPSAVASNVVATAAGNYHSLFLTDDNSLWAMGRNDLGQLGIGTTNDQFAPVVVASNVVAVAAGDNHSLFITTNEVLWTMGHNYWGQLGNGTNGNFNPNPTPLMVASNVVAAAAGGGHSLFLKRDGTLWGMGTSGSGQLAAAGMTNHVVPILMRSNVVSLAAGGGFSLFVTMDGVFWAVGSHSYGQLGSGATSSTNVPVVVASNVIAIAAGGNYSLFVTSDGTLRSMGGHSYGELGNGLAANFDANPTPAAVASNVVAVAAGYYHSMFVKGDGSLWTAGRNTDGQLGDGSMVHSTNQPVPVPGQIIATPGGGGVFHTLAIGLLKPQISQSAHVVLQPGQQFEFTPVITGSGPFAFQWQFNGTNIAGATNHTHLIASASQANDGSYTLLVDGLIGAATATTKVAVRILPQVEVLPPGGLVVAGAAASLAVTNLEGLLDYQWFKDGVRLVGQTNSTLHLSSFQFTSGGSYNVVVTSAYGPGISQPTRLSVTDVLHLFGWGLNNQGQLGSGVVTAANLPAVMASNVVAAAGGANHSLFVDRDGRLWTVGFNNSGQLGNGTSLTTNKPNVVASNVVAVAGGASHSLFVKSDGNLLAMGWNIYGQLGKGLAKNQRIPIWIANHVVAVAAGNYHSLFVTGDGTLWAMGQNSSGQLGNGNMLDQARPVAVAHDVVALAAGGQHSLFVKKDGTLWAMGLNGFGQLGCGDNTNRTSPVAIAHDVTAVAGGYYHSLFVRSDATLWAMGFNNYGQLGNGKTTSTNLAVSVADNVAAVAAGYYHSLFTKNDASLWAMGLNTSGQLGNGTANNTNLPMISAGFTAAGLGAVNVANHSLAIGLLAPQISGLTNGKVLAGQSFSLNPTIGGSGPFSYQWQFNGVNISGATNSSFAIANAPPSAAGIYTIVVTGVAGVSSASASLSIIGLLTWTLIEGGNGPELNLKFTGRFNRFYTLQAATNLTPPVIWESVSSKGADLNGHCLFPVTNLNGAQKFFRVSGLWP
jgi:alpha-tubulin suppressor-like RCC1 family protein